MKPPYFLYAEDDQDDIDILNEVLTAHPSKITIVAVDDGYQLLKFLQEVSRNKTYPALIILDMMLPRLSGLQTLEFLKTDDLYRLIPVAMFTTKSDPSQTAQCRALGADTFLKPSGFKDWHGVVEHFCSYIET